MRSVSDLADVFATFDAVRRERCQWLVQSSRFTGDLYEWRAKDIGRDFQKIEHEINTRNRIIANVDVEQMCQDAIKELNKRVSAT